MTFKAMHQQEQR